MLFCYNMDREKTEEIRMKIDKETIIAGKRLWDTVPGPVKDLAPLCRKIAAEGSVLLKNDNVLPFKKGEKIAVFGRIQETYIKSGTGSGGLVNVEQVPCILTSLRENGIFEIDETLALRYAEWIEEHPFDNGHGWATEPWCQEEMAVDCRLAEKAASRNDAAVIIIGRTAGEDKDNSTEKGSYYLTGQEEEMIANVTAFFDRVAVILNVGNLVDLGFMDRYPVGAVMYVWQGGQEGANALADLLAGKVSPCGKLPDTQARTVESYPSYHNFSYPKKAYYQEDIYVGYRYFETFAKEKVRYPFGYGLTYTTFDVSCTAALRGDRNTVTAVSSEGTVADKITVTAEVKNTGTFPARQVVQVYYGAPCGRLGTPEKQLIAYQKTKELQPGESETLTMRFAVDAMASYDDSGITGNPSCYVMEAGDYGIYAGTDVRVAEKIFVYSLAETMVTKQLEEALTGSEPFERYVAKETGGCRIPTLQSAPMRRSDLDERIAERRPKEIPFTGYQGIQLVDVADGKRTMEAFIAQMTDEDLCAIVCGEGMNSPKVTPGTGGAFGGVTDSLLDLGIPVCCVTDGPSGIRIGDDLKSTSLPNGYVFASAFDDALTEAIFELEGMELFGYNIDAILGPGMNIHRHPLCGRNFEYFSEDPLLSGKTAAAMTRGVARSGCSTTIKHFCCNNQEYARFDCNAVVSERALREIYLRGFEIAVKEGGATAVMTTYNPVNGYWNASNYDLTTTVLRKEWEFDGFVMTDWWARCNCKGEEGTGENLKAMVRAQNDVYMVCDSAAEKSHNLYEGLKEGYISRGDLQRSAANLLGYIINSPTFAKFVDGGCVKPEYENYDESGMETAVEIKQSVSGCAYACTLPKEGDYLLILEVVSRMDALAQTAMGLAIGENVRIGLSVEGTDGQTKVIKRKVRLGKTENTIIFDFPAEIEVDRLALKYKLV